MRQARSSHRSKFSLGAVAIAGLSLLGACQQQETPIVDQEPVCALVMIDSYETSLFSPTSHGKTVRRAAEQLGSIDLVAEYDQRDTEVSRDELPYQRLNRELSRLFSSGDLSPEQASEQFDTFLIEVATQSLDLITSRAADVNEVGFENSALNLSLGLNQLSLVNLTSQAASKSNQYEANLDRALGLNGNTSNRERKQALLDRVSVVVENNSEIRDARNRWRNEVVEFESRNSSVVVSAGNSGGTARDLRMDGYTISPLADENFLAVPEVSVIGAMGDRQSIASYSRIGTEVDIYASGNFRSSQGTSVAAPRYSGAIRGVHCDDKDLTSAEAEAFIADELSYQSGTGVLALDQAAAEQFIAR